MLYLNFVYDLRNQISLGQPDYFERGAGCGYLALNSHVHLTHSELKFCIGTKATRAAVDSTPSQIPTFLPSTFTLGSKAHKMLPSNL